MKEKIVMPICGMALCAVVGCSLFTGNTERADVISKTVTVGMQTSIDGMVKAGDFKSAESFDVAAQVQVVIAGLPDGDKPSKKEEEEILRRAREEYVSVRKVVCQKWSESIWVSVSVKIDAAIKAGNFAKAVSMLKASDSVGVEEVDAAVKDSFAKYLDNVVYPAWVKFVSAKVDKQVAELVKAGKFAEAREVAWNAPLTGVAKVDGPLRAHCVELLRTSVNPVQLPVLEKELKALAAEYLADEDSYEAGIAKLRGYRLQRPYTKKIDIQLAAVVNEALKLRVDKEKTKSVFPATYKLLQTTANLVDDCDCLTTNVKSRVTKEAFSPKLEAYEAALKKYRSDLVKFDCTEAGADAAVAAADSVLRPLIAALGSGAETAFDSTTRFELGITALNRRVDAFRQALIADLQKKIEEREQRKLDAKIDSLRAEVTALAEAGKYDEARERAWGAAAEDGRLRATAVELVARTVNPRQWAVTEKEIREKVAEFAEAAEYDEAMAWLNDYPRIRTYAVEIDEKLSAVGEQAVGLGIDKDKVDAVVAETSALAAEVERLVNNADRIVSTRRREKMVSKELELALEEYNKALRRHDCTDSNAAELVASVRAKLEKLFAEAHPDAECGGLELGCNAYNARLGRLVAVLLDELLDKKYAAVVESLVKRVFEAVEAGQFDKARGIVRDEPMSGDPKWDARLYALRIGLVNSVINPADLKARLAVIDDKESAAEKEGKYAELLKWIEEYEYIADAFPAIVESVAAIRGAGAGYRLGDDIMADYAKDLLTRLASVLGKRSGSYLPKVDDKPLSEALTQFGTAFSAQYFDEVVLGALTTKIRSEVGELYNRRFAAIVTDEANAKLRERLSLAIDHALEDAEFCDFQVAKAETAIAEQIDGVPNCGHKMRYNAVLGDYARAMRLRKNGKELDADLNQALLLGAVYLGEPVVFDRALAAGAKVDGAAARDPMMRAPVLLAVQLGRAGFLEKARKAGASLKVVDAFGNGIVHYAVERGDLALLKTAMDGNDVNLKNADGETPLFIAARKNQPVLVKTLTGVGMKADRPRADVAVANVRGMTAFDAACASGARDVLDILVEAGAVFGTKELVLAVRYNRLAIVRWLVAAGVDANGEGVMAAARQCSDVKRYLVSQGGVPLPCDGACCTGRSAEAALWVKDNAVDGSPLYGAKEAARETK